MSTLCQGFKQFLGFLHPFVLAKLATGSMRVSNNSAGRRTAETSPLGTFEHSIVHL